MHQSLWWVAWSANLISAEIAICCQSVSMKRVQLPLFSLARRKSKHPRSHETCIFPKSCDVSWETKCLTNVHVHSALCHSCLIVLSHFPFRMAGIVFWRIQNSRRSKNLMGGCNDIAQYFASLIVVQNCGAKISGWSAQKLLRWGGSKFSFTGNATTVRNVHREWCLLRFSELGSQKNPATW